MNRINITPYAYIKDGWVHMFRSCPKHITELPEVLYGFGQTIYPNIFTNRRGIRMIESKFYIDSSWTFYDTIRMTSWINQGLSEYLKRH